MPVEESANMLIMVAAYLGRVDATTARAFADRHHRILKQWSGYLVANALAPGPPHVPLDIRHAYTKADWELWTAAWLHDQPIRDHLNTAVYDFANASPSRAPFTDWYDTVSNRQIGFQARPVVGAVFALLSLKG